MWFFINIPLFYIFCLTVVLDWLYEFIYVFSLLFYIHKINLLKKHHSLNIIWIIISPKVDLSMSASTFSSTVALCIAGGWAFFGGWLCLRNSYMSGSSQQSQVWLWSGGQESCRSFPSSASMWGCHRFPSASEKGGMTRLGWWFPKWGFQLRRWDST